MITKNPEISQKICPTCFLELSISESNRNQHDSCGSEISDSEISDSAFLDLGYLDSRESHLILSLGDPDFDQKFPLALAKARTLFRISPTPVSADQRARNILGFREATAADLEMAEDLGLV